MRKVAIHNLGCKVNSYESESMEQMLVQAGYQMVTFGEEPADVYIINTCSVTNIADRKSRQMLHKAKKLNPNAVVIAAGCYAQADSENVQKDEAVDIVLGNNKKINLLEILEDYFKEHEGNAGAKAEYTEDVNVLDMSQQQPYEELEIDKVNEHTRAFIKIQDGCNQFCSYCIIPYLRGRIRSRKMEDISAEVKRLVANGYKEIVLTGIHLTSYGADNGEGSLLEVIQMIHAIDGVERIRLGSLEPRVVTEEFVQTISKLEKVCPHFHLSLQSGCDATLKRMNRKYTTKQYADSCDLLRKYYKNPAITTDVIVGFPAETPEEFEQTKLFLEKIHFYEMHIFKYSRRHGTVADKMDNQIDEQIKTQRSGILIDLEKKMSLEYRKLFLGTKVDVLLEEKVEMDGTFYYVGYTKNYVRVRIAANDLERTASVQPVTEEELVNTIVMVNCEKLVNDIIIEGQIAE